MLQRFIQDRSGSIAVNLAVAVVPLLTMTGMAVDYSRAASAKSHLQQAVDAAALEAGKRMQTDGSTPPSVRDQRARAAYDANITQVQEVTTTAFTVTDASQQLTITANAKLQLFFSGFLGGDYANIRATATVPYGASNLEVALVLDNTGSMADNNKLVNVKIAAKNLLNVLEDAQSNGQLGKASVALVPFHTQVRLDTSNRNAIWLGYRYSWYEPRLNVSPGSWPGCVADRDSPYDANLTAPAVADSATLYPPSSCEYSNLSKVVPLSTDFNALRSAIDGMTPTGNTNTTIGLAWGMNMLTKGMPLGDAASASGPGSAAKAIIFLTDGTNTENRFGYSQSSIDNRMQTLCNLVKKTGIQVYTVRVMDGNETLLKSCASMPQNYFSITDPSQLDPLFQQIANQLVKLRLAT